MEEKIKSLEGITFREWQKLKRIIDDEFEEEKEKNTFKYDENVLKRLNLINQLETHLVDLK